jgi:hypothetical protein
MVGLWDCVSTQIENWSGALGTLTAERAQDNILIVVTGSETDGRGRRDLHRISTEGAAAEFAELVLRANETDHARIPSRGGRLSPSL